MIPKRKREVFDHPDYQDAYQTLPVRNKRKRKDIADYPACSVQQRSMYQRNSLRSQLLSLPAEIRNEIYSYVLTDQVIHISVRNCPQFDQGSYTHADYYQHHRTRASKNDEERHTFLKFTHSVCTLPPQTEDDAYTLTKAGKKNGKSPVAKENTYRTRHEPCYHAIRRLKDNWARCGSAVTIAPWFQQVISPRLAVQFLQTCRQIYSEARGLIYTSNTFAFHEGHTLELFLSKCLTRAQRSLITRLQIDGWKNDYYDPGSRTKIATLQSLTGLKSLDVAVTNAHNDYCSLRRGWAFMDGKVLEVHHGEDVPSRQDQNVVRVTVDHAENGLYDATEIEKLVQKNVETALGYHERCCASVGDAFEGFPSIS